MKNIKMRKLDSKGNVLNSLVGRNANKNASKIDDKLFYDLNKFWLIF
jgi:hypothetical protein